MDKLEELEEAQACELLVKEAKEVARCEALILSMNCETLEEFREKLRERLNL